MQGWGLRFPLLGGVVSVSHFKNTCEMGCIVVQASLENTICPSKRCRAVRLRHGGEFSKVTIYKGRGRSLAKDLLTVDAVTTAQPEGIKWKRGCPAEP